MERGKLIQVIIIAPGIATRAGLRALMSEDPQISVVAEASTFEEADISMRDADVLVWLPGSTGEAEESLIGIENLPAIRTIALLLIHEDPAMLGYLIRLPVKVWGMVNPEASQSELIAGVQALSEGLTVIHPTWVSEITKAFEIRRDGNEKNLEELTTRELEILELLALGLTNKQIAARLKISAHTVKFHVSTIFGKLGTTNRVETVNLGLRKGLIVL